MTVIDVRTVSEFLEGHVEGSINIPLQEISTRVQEFEGMEKPILLCCASGNRSGQATTFLTRQGIECQNAGSWLSVRSAQALKKETA